MTYIMSMLMFVKITEECRRDKEMVKRLHTPHDMVLEYVNKTFGLYREVVAIVVR